MLKAEVVIMTLLYGYVKWTLHQNTRNTHSAPNGSQPPLPLTDGWLPELTTNRPPLVVLYAKTLNKAQWRRDKNRNTASPLCGGRTVDEQWAGNTPGADVRDGG